ncbi:hypothetical protein LTR95_009134 [Oleoguttula sp. CCFEE 5521]
MKILFLCTAHNSLSQRLQLTLSRSHHVTIEYALSDQVMIDAVALAQPDLVLCPFLTTIVPKAVYERVLTLIVHPGPPGDVGPSALDWLLMGDDGSVDNADELLRKLDQEPCTAGRGWWGVTVLQAIEDFDAGPVWAYQQFPINIDEPGLTKSALYRGSVSRAALIACEAAVTRIEQAVNRLPQHGFSNARLCARTEYRILSVLDDHPFQGGRLHHRPLLKAASRDFDTTRHTAQQISRRIRCGDSQPGVLSKIFGASMYIYGGIVDESLGGRQEMAVAGMKTTILATRGDAVCIPTADGKGIWITHIRRPKGKNDKALWPKVPAVFGLLQLNLINAAIVASLHAPTPADWSLSELCTFQEIWVDVDVDEHGNRVAFLHFDFYNGAMSTSQCSELVSAMEYIITLSTPEEPIRAVVLMGGAYFSNGIALNVIDAAADPAQESFMNINRIDDVCHHLLHDFPENKITTIAAVRGNAAAGGVALATACDFVIASSEVVLNPAYRASGLFGSEYHTLSYYGRCGEAKARHILNAMVPMSPLQARQIGLVDFIFPGAGEVLDDHIRSHVSLMLRDNVGRHGFWKKNVDVSPAGLAKARSYELSEMSKDFWSPRATRYHTRRFDFVRKVKPTSTPLRFARHRRQSPSQLDEEEMPEFDSVAEHTRRAEQEMLTQLRAAVWSDVSTQLEDWDEEREQIAASGRRLPKLILPQDAVTPPTPTELLTPVLSADVTPLIFAKAFPHLLPMPPKKIETLFSCYYHPLDSLLTPPESPMPGRNRFEERFGQF